MISSSRLAELQHVPPAWKFCAVQSQERFDRENAQRADRRKWKTTARPQKTLPGSPERGHEKNKDRPQGPRGRSAPRLLSWGCAGTAGCPAASATPGGCPPAWLATSCGQHVCLRARVVVLEGHERAHRAAAKRARPRKRANLARSKISDFGPELRFEQRNRFRSLRGTRATEKKVLRKPPAGGPVVGQTFKYIY